jgi:hypothetical protein
MYVARRPSVEEVARDKAHADLVAVAATERAQYEQGWRFIGAAGEPGLTSEFSNSSSAPVAYFKESEGFVMLAGECTYNGPTDYANYRTVFILPVGYRPGKGLRLFEPGTGTMLLFIADGRIFFRMAPFSTFRTMRFDGIRFRVN